MTSLTDRMPGRDGRLLVIALGGNAIQQPGQQGTFEEQLFNIDTAARHIAGLEAAGHKVVVTHGNGPQVGNLLIQNEVAASMIAPMPMDVCGAETQGQIGYMFQQCLANHLRRLGKPPQVATILTETEVAADDPAFAHPSKPVGPFYDEKRARELQLEKGFVMREDAGRGWRRVVPSPEPRGHVQLEAIRQLVETGTLLICSGGGGVPSVRTRSGDYSGVEAVIDKDLAAAVLARDLHADGLVILTDVPNAYLRYNTPQQTPLCDVGVDEMQRYLDEGHFSSGSMGPKIEAALRFAREGGRAIIASLSDLDEALLGKRGTSIRPAPPAKAALAERRVAAGP
jgi:carbamate kinase